MRTRLEDPKAEAAMFAMRRNREELLAAFAQVAPGSDAFPRSATFRWITAHLTARSLASTALTAMLWRRSMIQLLGRFAFRRRL